MGSTTLEWVGGKPSPKANKNTNGGTHTPWNKLWVRRPPGHTLLIKRRKKIFGRSSEDARVQIFTPNAYVLKIIWAPHDSKSIRCGRKGASEFPLMDWRQVEYPLYGKKAMIQQVSSLNDVWISNSVNMWCYGVLSIIPQGSIFTELTLRIWLCIFHLMKDLQQWSKKKSGLAF